MKTLKAVVLSLLLLAFGSFLAGCQGGCDEGMSRNADTRMCESDQVEDEYQPPEQEPVFY
ncbi:MAG: hypothetical protein ACR2PJ_03555 [Pseudomonadales bacterium]